MKYFKTVPVITVILTALFALQGCNENSKDKNEMEGKLLILQAYGSSYTAAGATHSFVELYNVSDKDIELNGVSLYYADGVRGADFTEDKPWSRLQLKGKIPAKRSFLILGQNQNSAGARYKIETVHGKNYGDLNESEFSLNNRSFKIVLIQGNKTVNMQNPFNIDGKGTKIEGYIDMAGAANNPNHATDPDNIFGYETAPARCSASEAIRRRNLTDTNNNSDDFIAARYGATSGSSISLTDEEFEVRYPRNSRYGSWDPFMEPAVPDPTTAGEPSEYAGKLMILQAGASTNGAITRSFVELYNDTDNSIDLSAFSLHFGATGANWAMIQLSGNIPGKSSYLIRGPLSTETADSRLYIENADLTDNTFNLSNQGFKIALMENKEKLTVSNPFSMPEGSAADYVDMLGAFNSSTDSVDAFETEVFSPISKQAAARRKSLVDTDNNSNDFERIDYRRTGINDTTFERVRPRYSENGPWSPATASAESARPPVLSHKSGLYAQSFQLTMTTDAGNAIYYSINGSIPDPSKASTSGPVYKYTSPITVQNRNGQANLLATSANSEKFYGFAWDPRGNMPTPYIPNNNQVPKATVIRALTVNSTGNKSDTVTSTYFIGNNLANYASHPVMSLVTDPYNLVDQDYGIYVRGRDINRWDGLNQYNFLRRGTEWERPAVLELFEGNTASRTVPVSTTVGIRIRGGWSRDRGQKSFNVYFRQEYGINNLTDYNLIPGAVQSNGMPVSTYKSFMLRNGGNDTEQTKVYDVFIQNLLKDRNFGTQAGIPCIVYINGEYWGFYNLQERYSDNHTEYKYGVNRNNVISFDNGELDDGNPGEDSLYWSLMSYRNRDLSINANYEELCGLMDIQSFIDYFAANIYINNEDWPHNNYRLWRVRNIEPGNPYGDGKWRWQMFDTEFALGIYVNGDVKNIFSRILNESDHPHSQMFSKLIKNNDFSRQFVNTMMDLYNVNYHPDFYTPELNRMADIYRPLMVDYNERFNNWRTFDPNINSAKNYLQNVRNTMTANFLPNNFKHLAIAGTLANVTLNAKVNSANLPNASIKINTTTVNLRSASWIGQYYSAIPITVTAIIPNGYNFVNWTVSGGTAVSSVDTTTAVNFSGNVTITANYSLN